MRRAIAVVLLLAGFVLTGCMSPRATGEGQGRAINGSGRLRMQTFDLNGFTVVDASNAFEVQISSVDAYLVEIEADDNLFEYLQVRREGNRLRLALDDTRISALGTGTLRARVVMPRLEAIYLTGGARATVQPFLVSGGFTAHVSGTSVLKGNVAADRMLVEASSASTIALTGSADELLVSGSGASRMQLDGLTAATASVSLSGAAQASVAPRDKLDYSASSGSRLEYRAGVQVGQAEATGGSVAVAH